MVNAVSFGKRDNENNPTGGKWIGAGLGAAWGAYGIYSNNKITKEIQEFLTTTAGKKIDECKDFDSFKRFINESTLSQKAKNIQNAGIKGAQWVMKVTKTQDQTKIANDFITKFKNSKKAGAANIIFSLAFLGAIGLGIGAIVDHFRKKDVAD